MNSHLLTALIVITLIVGSAVSRVVCSGARRAAPGKKSAARLDDRDVDLLGGRVQG